MPNDYFMTMNQVEARDYQRTIGYVGESVVCWLFGEPTDATVALYRLRSSGGIHFYTSSATEMQSLASSGWTLEGAAGYLYPEQVGSTVPLYRLLGPGSVHFYTTSDVERDGLLMCPGWTFEAAIGYVYSAPGTVGTGEMLRLWSEPKLPPAPPQPPPPLRRPAMVVVNNSPNPLLVSGSFGTDLSDVAVGSLIPPFGGVAVVALFTPDESDDYDWVYLTDLALPQQYQLYVGQWVEDEIDVYIGYFDPTSGKGPHNPSPFPDGTASAAGAGAGLLAYTLNSTPQPGQSDFQALTTTLGYLLAGSGQMWTASTTFDTHAHPELAPYLADQVTAAAATDAQYAPKNEWTSTPGASENHPGCYQNSTSIAATANAFNQTLTRTTTFTWSLTETINVTWKYSTTVPIPEVEEGTSTTEWSVSFSVSSTQSQTLTQAVSIIENWPVPIPATTTVQWLLTFTDNSYVIPFTIPITLSGYAAVKSTTPVGNAALQDCGATQVATDDGNYLVLAPLGSLLRHCLPRYAALAAMPYTYVSTNAVLYEMAGRIAGGPIVVANFDSKSYPGPNGGAPPTCESLPPMTGAST
jgi:hypothetical protein